MAMYTGDINDDWIKYASNKYEYAHQNAMHAINGINSSAINKRRSRETTDAMSGMHVKRKEKEQKVVCHGWRRREAERGRIPRGHRMPP